MKTRIFYAVEHYCLLFLVLFAISCTEEDGKVNDSFILKTNASIKNSNELAALEWRLDTINDLTAFVFQKSHTKGHISDSILNSSEERPIRVSLKKAVGDLFDPVNHPCSLPKKVENKLKRLKDDGKQWAPSYVTSHIANMPDTVLYVPRNSLSNLLHTIVIKKPTSTTTSNWLLVGSPTYENLEVEKYLISGSDAFFYTLDCAGYINAAIEGSAAVPGADIQAKAKSALESQTSMFIGGGIVRSPLFAAIYNDASGISMDTMLRIKILKSIVAIPEIGDNDVVTIPFSYDVIWSSKSGKSSFNGQADLNTGGGMGIGVAQVTASGQTGGSVSRKSSFSSFDTYVVQQSPTQHPVSMTITQIKALIATLERRPPNT